MQRSLNYVGPALITHARVSCTIVGRRSLSVNSAINRSLRSTGRSHGQGDRPESGPSRALRGTYDREYDVRRTPGRFHDRARDIRHARNERPRSSQDVKPHAKFRDVAQESGDQQDKAVRDHSTSSDSVLAIPSDYRDGDERQRRPSRSSRSRERMPMQDTFAPNDEPMSLPYTTAASEFLYGTSVIKAALQGGRRKLYKLYMYDGQNRDAQNEDVSIRRLALQRGLRVERLHGPAIRLMDKMSQGRPHNGFILEASKLPKTPIVALQRSEGRGLPLLIDLDHQSQEDELINGGKAQVPTRIPQGRYPFVLLLDGILDGGNLGAILRSAFFLGVDAVAISTHCAALSPVVLKASAGAAETMPLLSVAQPNLFLSSCRDNGWKSYAADAPGKGRKGRKVLTTLTVGSPLEKNPCILIMGSEGDGLRWKVQQMADMDIGIEGARMGHNGVESLNVSVAAALLCQAFLQKGEAELRQDEEQSLF